MASSYFDAQPAKAQPPATLLDIPEGSDVRRTGLLSPQVSRILDDLELDEKSSSEDDNASLSGDTGTDKDTGRHHQSRRGNPKQEHSIRKAQTSPLPRAHNRVQAQHQLPSRGKLPHLARFHSLRSMLFASRIEDNIQKSNESKMQEEAEAKWREEHDSRRALNRPKTPDGQSPSREGLGKRVRAGLKRMTSKGSPPPMARIPEDNASTASDDEEGAYQNNEEDITHSDVEELKRWVSRRDPPSDGEARNSRTSGTKPSRKTDSGHESLGHSDVEELVQWLSRKDHSQQNTSQSQDPVPPTNAVRHGYSDASTESDSEAATRSTDPAHRRESLGEDDVDELVRWISHKDGPNAGPVRKRNEKTGAGFDTLLGLEPQDPQTEELIRWATRKDDTSGESVNASQENLATIIGYKEDPKVALDSGSSLKKVMSHAEPVTKREPLEKDRPLTHEDVEDLVRWVSRKNSDSREV